MKALLIDTAGYPSSWTEREVLKAWFGPLLEPSGTGVSLEAVAMSSPALPARALAEDVDAVIVTGSPEDAASTSPHVLTLCEVLRELSGRGTAVLGICFGHQILARALGGIVGRNPAGWETGNAVIRLTEAGLACPVLAGLGPEPCVLQSHQDAVLTLPPGGILLAWNDVTPVQAFLSRPGGRQIGLQFHPEFTPERLRGNWTQRRSAWRGRTAFDLDAALDEARPTPHTADLFRRFFGFAAQAGKESPIGA